MPEPRIVTEKENNIDWSTQHDRDTAHTIRTFAAALEGKWHDEKCESEFPPEKGYSNRYCFCADRLLEHYHA